MQRVHKQELAEALAVHRGGDGEPAEKRGGENRIARKAFDQGFAEQRELDAEMGERVVADERGWCDERDVDCGSTLVHILRRLTLQVEVECRDAATETGAVMALPVE